MNIWTDLMELKSLDIHNTHLYLPLTRYLNHFVCLFENEEQDRFIFFTIKAQDQGTLQIFFLSPSPWWLSKNNHTLCQHHVIVSCCFCREPMCVGIRCFCYINFQWWHKCFSFLNITFTSLLEKDIGACWDAQWMPPE